MPDTSALVFDLDNTLLRRGKTISAGNIAALERAAAAGFALVIATSRPIRSIRQFVPARLLDRCVTISLNGAVTWYPGAGVPRFFGRIGGTLAPLLHELARTSHPLSYSLETDGHHFGLSHPLDLQTLWSVHSATPEMVLPADRIDPQHITKVAVDGHGSELGELLALAERFSALRFIPADARTFLNIVPANVDKAETLGIIAGELGMDLSASVAFGDDVPDLGLLSLVGTGIAMGNGHEAVRAVADEVIGDCDEDTIARWIAQNLLR